MKFALIGLSLLLGTVTLLAGCGGGSSSNVTPPILMSPADRATSISVRTPFTWLSINGATYDFQLAKDSEFKNIVEQVSGTKTNNYMLNAKLVPETVYYWRVRAKVFLHGASQWVTFKFTTGADVVAPPPPPPPRE